MLVRRTALIIPAFNEEDSIFDVVKGASTYGDVIVVNDASKDQTSTLATLAGAHVLEHSQNLGYESALNSGFAYAATQAYDYIITLDADGQHAPLLLTHFIRALDEGAELVVGRRSRLQRWSESIFSLVGRVLWGISDPLCGMKGYRLSSVRAPEASDNLSLIGTKLMVQMIRSDARIVEVPITTRTRKGPSRFGSGVSVNLQVMKALITHLITSH